MAKKKRVPKPSDLSLAQLKELMDEKSSELSELRSQRAELQRQLNDLDQQIREAEGGRRKKKSVAKKTARGGMPAASAGRKKKKVSKKKKGTRAKNVKSAKQYAIDILKNEPRGLTLNDLADRILESGYKTKSKNFKSPLYQSLYNDRKSGKNFNFNEKTGLWTLR